MIEYNQDMIARSLTAIKGWTSPGASLASSLLCRLAPTGYEEWPRGQIPLPSQVWYYEHTQRASRERLNVIAKRLSALREFRPSLPHRRCLQASSPRCSWRLPSLPRFPLGGSSV